MAFRRGSGRGTGYNPMASMPPIRRSAFSSSATEADATSEPSAGASASSGTGFQASQPSPAYQHRPPRQQQHRYQPPSLMPSIGAAVPSLMQMGWHQQQQFYGYNPAAAGWHGYMPGPPQPQYGWSAGSSGGGGKFNNRQSRRGGGGGARGGFPQPLLFSASRGGAVGKSGHAKVKQHQKLQGAVGMVTPLMTGVKQDRTNKKQQQQQQQPEGDQQGSTAPSRPAAEIIADVQRALRDTCANIDRRQMHLQTVIYAVRERVPDFHFHYVFALARDLDLDALRNYYGDNVAIETNRHGTAAVEEEESEEREESVAAKSEPPIETYTVLCDLYVCYVFSGVQGRGCNQLSARLDACRRFIEYLVDSELSPPRIIDIRRAWQKSSILVQCVATFPESKPAEAPAVAEEKPEVDDSAAAAGDADEPKKTTATEATKPSPPTRQFPPLLSMYVGSSSHFRFEVRARGVSQCLLKLLSNAPISNVNLTCWEPEAPAPPSLLGELGGGVGTIVPILAADPWSTPSAADSSTTVTSMASPELSTLFVCHPAAHAVKPMPAIAQFRLTCHFNNLHKVTSSSIGPVVSEGRERPNITAQLHLGSLLLSQSEGDTLESAKTAAAQAFIDSASQLQPVIRVHRTCPPRLPVVTKDDLVARGKELFEANEEKYQDSLYYLLKQAASGASPVMSRTFWQHLVAKQPSLEEFLLYCLAYFDEFYSLPLECRVFGSDLEFPEMCALYSCVMCGGFNFQVDAVLEDNSSPCHQRLLVHKQLDTVEIKRRLLADGSFARLELVSLGSRIDQVKAALEIEAS